MALDRKSMKLLKFLSKHPNLSTSQINQMTLSESAVNPHTKELQNNGFIEATTINDDGEWLFSITCTGQGYIETTTTGNRRYWITTGIAIVALIKAFLPEISAGLASLLKLLMQ